MQKSKEIIYKMNDINILDLKKTGIEPLNQLETFMLVEGTKHYYISSEGRLANNIKGKFYVHADTLTSGTNKVHWKIFYEDDENMRTTKDVKAEYLVAEAFLEKVPGKNMIYHIDGDDSNSKYNNLMYVSPGELSALKTKKKTIDDLSRIQEYVPFMNINIMKARRLWNDMQTRCYNWKLHKRFPKYFGCTICDEWREDKTRFYKWVEENYYSIGDEQMDLDKDILFKGNKIYSPDTCIFVPHSINTLVLNNSAKRGKFPIGVCKDGRRYRGSLNIDGKNVHLHYWKTPEEAFAEYKRHKEALILIMADKYKGKIPEKVYEALINWKIEIDD